MKAIRHIPASRPSIGEEEIAAVVEVLRSGRLSLGPKLDAFEQAFASFVQSQHAVAVSSGTAGLHLCMRAANIGEGDEVITTPFSFIASANCIEYERATPVFVDIDEHTLGMDAQLTKAAISDKTKALLPVHVFGQLCDISALQKIAESAEQDIFLIEDACEALGATRDKKHAGTFGTLGVFAFYANKQMTTGEGGMIVTDNAETASFLRALRNQGRTVHNEWLTHDYLGYNYRLDELSCALGHAQLQRLPALLAARRKCAAAYTKALHRLSGIIVPQPEAEEEHSWFQYVIRVREGIARNAVLAALYQRGIEAKPYFFPPLHLQKYYQEKYKFHEGAFPVAEAVSKTTIALPFYADLSAEDIQYVVACVEEAIAEEGG